MHRRPRSARLPVALTLLAQLVLSLCSCRPGERVVITIDRLEKTPFPADSTPGASFKVEGTVNDGGAIYRKIRSVNLVAVRDDASRPEGVYYIGTAPATFSSADGRFSVTAAFGIPTGIPSHYVAVEVARLRRPPLRASLARQMTRNIASGSTANPGNGTISFGYLLPSQLNGLMAIAPLRGAAS